MFTFITLTGPVLLVTLLTGPSAATVCQLPALTPTTFDQRAFARFDDAVDRYVGLHRHLARRIGPLDAEGDEGGTWYTEALRTALRRARPHAHQGQVFHPDIAGLLRIRLEVALALHTVSAADLPPGPWTTHASDAARPRVHDEFTWNAVRPAWATLTLELPPLPEELVYRFVGRDLVLVDVDAEMVVDVLEDALPLR
jgi:hypothetical protein